MAKLTKTARAAIPTSKFAGPNRSFPIPDKAHARAAIMLSNHAADPAAIRAAARRVLEHNGPNLGGYLHPKKSR